MATSVPNPRMRGQSKRPLLGRAISEQIHKTTLQPGRRLPPQPTTRKGEVILIESDDDESGDEPEMISELATPSRRTLLSRPTRPTSLRRADGPIVPQHKVSVSTLSRRVDDTRPPASSTRYLGQTREALPKKTGNSEGTSGRKPASGPAITATTTAKKSAWPPPEPFLSQPPHAFPLAVKARIYPATQRPGRQQKGNSGLKTLETFGFQPAASHLPKAATETTPRNSAFAAAALIPTHTTASTALPKLRPVPTPPKREAIQTHGSSSRSCQSLPRTPRHATAVSPRPSVSTTTPAAKPIKQEAGGQLPSSSSSRMARVALLPPRTPENKTSARRAPVVSASPTVGTYGDPYTISSDSDSDSDSDGDSDSSGGGGNNKDSSRDEVREQRRRRSLLPSSPSKGFFAALYADVTPRNADRIPSYLDTPSSGAELRSCTYRHPRPAVAVATADNNTRFTARDDGRARPLTATTNTTTTTTPTTRPWIRTLWPKREEKEDEDEEKEREGEREGKIGPFSAAERRGEQLFRRRRVAPGGAREPDNPIPLSLPRPRPRLHPPLPPPPPPPPTPASRATTAAVDAVTPTPKPSNLSLSSSSSSSLSRKTDDNKLTPAVMAMAPPAQIQKRTACSSATILSDRNQHVKKEEEEAEEEEEGEGIAGSQQQQHADHRHQHRHHPTRMQSQDDGGGGEIQLPQPARPPKHKHEHKGKRDHDRDSKRASRHRNRDRAGWQRQRRRRKREQQRREEEREREKGKSEVNRPGRKGGEGEQQ